MLLIFVISGVIVLVLTLGQSISRTKSAARWLKGLNLKQKKTSEEVFQLLKGLQHPDIESIDYNAEGKIVVNTKLYNFVTEVAENKEGNTTVAFLVNWAKISKRKRKKVAFCWDELYIFLQQLTEGNGMEVAMQAYEKKRKLSKVLNIASVVCVVSVIILMLTMA